MALLYHTRRKCNYEDSGSSPGDPGNGKGWHYIFEDQTTIDESADCPVHPLPTVQDIEHFVIISLEET